MNNTTTTDLRQQLHDFAVSYRVESRESRSDDLDDMMKLIGAATQRAAVMARIDERKQVALDNYRGQTFSDSTNWRGKFDKFINNNEGRIVQLQALADKENQ